jgi:hypothetical protein
MIDLFSLGLSHGLMLLAAWRLLSRPDLEDDKAEPTAKSGIAAAWANVRGRTGA